MNNVPCTQNLHSETLINQIVPPRSEPATFAMIYGTCASLMIGRALCTLFILILASAFHRTLSNNPVRTSAIQAVVKPLQHSANVCYYQAP